MLEHLAVWDKQQTSRHWPELRTLHRNDVRCTEKTAAGVWPAPVSNSAAWPCGANAAPARRSARTQCVRPTLTGKARQTTALTTLKDPDFLPPSLLLALWIQERALG